MSVVARAAGSGVRRPVSVLRRLVVPAAYVILVLAWEVYGVNNQRPGAVIVPPSVILQTLWDTRTALLINSGTTLAEAGLGLAIGTAVAIVMAVFIDRFRAVGDGVYRLALIFYAIPLIAIAAPLVAWLGLGFWTKVVIAATGAYFPIIVNLTTALRTLDPRVNELGRVLAMGYTSSLLRLRMHAVLPTFFSSLKIAGPAAFIAAIIGEWMGAETGLGVALMNAMFGFRIPQLWAVLVVCTALNGAIILLADRVARVATPWHQSNSKDEL